MSKNFYRLAFFLLVFLPIIYVYLFRISNSNIVDTANFTNSSVVLSNSRLSFKAGISNASSKSSLITIARSGNPNNNTDQLFAGDSVCFTSNNQYGCIGNTVYTIANITDAYHFNLTTPLISTPDSSDYVVIKQPGSLTFTFTTVKDIPSNGHILLTIPMADNANGNDGLPDSSDTAASSGFDLNNISSSNIKTTGCTDQNWNSSVVISPGSSNSDHTIKINRQTTACPAGSVINVVVGSPTFGIVNPAPTTVGHTQGQAEIYNLKIQTRNSLDNILDNIIVKAAPIEVVLVTATVEETMAFTVSGIASNSLSCDQNTDISTSATIIPWGTITKPDTFFQGAQQLTASTNASNGYTVQIEENDQMGRDGIICTGPTTGENNNCIQDTICNASACSESASQDWIDPIIYHGLGYSLENKNGTDATFTYNESSRTFSSKQLPDQESSEAKQIIMRNSGPVDTNRTDICYRISISKIQPGGDYFNIIRYTAMATF